MGFFDFLHKEKEQPIDPEMKARADALKREVGKHYQNGEWRECANLLEEVYGMSPDLLCFGDFFVWGYCLQKLALYPDALLAYEKSMKCDMKELNERYYKDHKDSSITEIVLLLLGGQKGGLPYVNLATLYNYAFTLCSLQRFQEAKWCVEYILKFSPSDSDAVWLNNSLPRNLLPPPSTSFEAAIYVHNWPSWCEEMKKKEENLKETELKKQEIGKRFSELGILNEEYSSGLPKETRTLGEAGVEVVVDRLREKPCDYVLYGSFPLMKGILPKFKRIPGDTDIQLYTGKIEAEKFAEELLTRLENVGEKVRLSPQNPAIIESFKTGRWERAVDIHHKEEVPEDCLSPLSPMNLAPGQPSGRTKVQSLVDALDFFRIMSTSVELAKQNHMDSKKIVEAESLTAQWKEIFSESIDFERLEIKGE